MGTSLRPVRTTKVDANPFGTLQAMGHLMDMQGNSLSSYKICSLLQECAKQRNLAAGRHLHSLMLKAGLVSIALYGDYLIHMFASCGSLAEIEQVFWNVSQPTVYTWNAIISAHAKLGDCEKALDFYHKMQQENNVKADKITLLCVLKSCSSIGAIRQGNLIHTQILESGFGTDLFIGNSLVDMYSKCGSLDDAHKVFDRMPGRDVVSWGAIITGYAQHGQGLLALELLKKMHQEGSEPNKVIYLCSLKACGSIKAFQFGNLLHEHIIEKGLDSDVAIGNTLIDMYAKCKSLEEARKVFDGLPYQSVVSWGAMIAGYAQHGHGLMALELFQNMQKKGIKPNMVIFVCVLKACGTVGALDQGKLVHRQVRDSLKLDMMVSNALIDMYTKCGCLKDGREVFEEMPSRDAGSYDAMISGYARHDQASLALELLHNMQQEGIKPNRSTFLYTLEVCSSLAQGQRVHCHTAKDGFDSDVVIGSALVDMYAKYGHIEEALEVFGSLSSQDVISWGVMIAGYAEHGQGLAALELFEKMKKQDVKPTIPTFLSALRACASIAVIKEGRLLHNEIITSGIESDSMIGSSLIDMYAKCRGLVEAYNVFKKLVMRDLVSWCSMISGYAQHGHGQCALELFEEMLQEGLKPDKGVFLSVLKACSSTKALGQGRLIHNFVILGGLESDVVVGSTILDLYAKCGILDEACKIFSGLPKHNAVSWGAMLVGYVQHGDGISALELFQKMQQEKVDLERVTILSLLKVCGSIGAVKQGRLIHDLIIGSRLERDVVLGNALVDMHAKCGGIEEARKVFDDLPCKDIVSWGAIIAAFARFGHFGRVIDCVKQMQNKGLRPTKAIFTNILAACSHGGILEGGHQSFNSMKEKHEITPNIEHYSCMADLLSRAGWLKEAEELLQSMPTLPDLLGWTSLLTSCKTYGNVGMGRHCFEQVAQLDPDDAAGHVLMANIYGDAYLWNDVTKVKEMRKRAGLLKKPGKAWIEIDNKLQEFVVGDDNQTLTREIGSKPRRLIELVREDGYVPQVCLVFEPLVAENEENTSFGHCENDALAVGLVNAHTGIQSTNVIQIYGNYCISTLLICISSLLICTSKDYN